jgi:caa(3)-type oxidase subunit IV
MNAAALYLFLAQTQIRRGELPPVAPEGGTFWMPLATTICSLFTYLVAIPSAVKTFNCLATMHGGSIVLKTPMLYTLAFIFVFGLGGLTGLFLGALSANVHLHGTYFIVAHFHYVMMGSAMTALVAGLHYWWSKITGRMYSERLGRLAFVIVVLGFNLTFFPQFILGSQGMPRRYYNYPPQFASLHQLSTAGAYLLTAGFVLIAVTKATLVVLYFMHLRYERPFNAIVLIRALLFVMVFCALTLMDSRAYQPGIQAYREADPAHYAPDLERP